MGVYVVNMETDQSRVIYKPPYFSDIPKENNYRFIPSMQAYNRTYVTDEDQKDFLALLNYDAIRRQFQAQQVIKYHYQKRTVQGLFCVSIR